MKSKVLAISLITLFSIILWVSVSLSGEFFTSVQMPIEFIDVNPQQAVGYRSADKLTVTVKGQGLQLAAMSLGRELEYVIPVKDALGRHSISSRASMERNSWVTSNIQIVEVDPEILTYEIEELEFKKVEIFPDTKLQFRVGYGKTSGIELNPDSALIYGPRSFIKEINKIDTDFLVLNDVDENQIVEVDLKEIDGISFENKKTTISFEVQKIVDKNFDNLRVETRDIPESLQLELIPPRISVVVRGGINLLGKMSNDDIEIFVTFSQALSDTVGSLAPEVLTPDFTEVIDLKPKRLQYIIRQL